MNSVLALIMVSHPSPESLNLIEREHFIKSLIDSDHHDRIIISETDDILFKVTVFVPKKICRGDDKGLVRQFIQKKINPEKNSIIEIIDFDITG
jgi:hypothetical protein